jgi:hypothetical protein
MRIFLLSPSFFSFVAGATISIATNILTTVLLSSSTTPAPGILYTAVAAMTASSICFILISIRLETIRAAARGGDLMPHIRTSAGVLGGAFVAGLACLVVSFTLLFIAPA